MTLAGKLNWVSRPLGQPLPLTEAVALYTELKTILEDSFRPIPPAQLIDLKPRDLAGYEREVKSLFNRAADEPSKKYFQQFLDQIQKAKEMVKDTKAAPLDQADQDFYGKEGETPEESVRILASIGSILADIGQAYPKFKLPNVEAELQRGAKTNPQKALKATKTWVGNKLMPALTKRGTELEGEYQTAWDYAQRLRKLVPDLQIGA